MMLDSPMAIMLRGLPYFARAADAQIEAMAERAIRREFTAGEMIYVEGEPSAGLWMVERGRVKAFKVSPDGGEYVLRIFGPGDTFNDLAALDGAPNAASAAAITAVVAGVIPTTAFVDALTADHELALSVVRSLVARQRQLVAQVEDLALRPVTARLARFLLEQVANPALAHPSVTRALIANHLATTSESISRSLRVLESAGTIRFDRHTIVITDLPALRELAQ